MIQTQTLLKKSPINTNEAGLGELNLPFFPLGIGLHAKFAFSKDLHLKFFLYPPHVTLRF